jgi:hypothetical protein
MIRLFKSKKKQNKVMKKKSKKIKSTKRIGKLKNSEYIVSRGSMLSRLKFSFDDLIISQLNHIPDSVWESDSTTFCDLQMAGGQYIRQIVKRLREFGHSDSNIQSRVFGFAENEFRLAYVTAKPELIGVFEVFNEEKVNDMKFDVVIGNPPYQAPGTKLGQGHLYPSFIRMGISVLKDGGILAYVTPPTFLKDKVDVIDGAKIEYIDTTAKDYFPKIGTSIISYILRKTSSPVRTRVRTKESEFEIQINPERELIPVGLMSKESFSIVQKIYDLKSDSKFEFERNVTPLPKNAVFIRRQNRNNTFNALKTGRGFDLKVNSDYTDTTRVDEKILLLNSKLFTFLYKCYSTSPFITLGFINNVPIPDEDITRATDSDIYRIYGISKEEIEYIEKNVAE